MLTLSFNYVFIVEKKNTQKKTGASPSFYAHNSLKKRHTRQPKYSSVTSFCLTWSIRYSCCTSNEQTGTAWPPRQHLFKENSIKTIHRKFRIEFYVREGNGFQYTVTQSHSMHNTGAGSFFSAINTRFHTSEAANRS